MANIIFTLIIVFILASYFLERWLDYLNEKNRSSKLPKKLEKFYNKKEYKKSQQYARENVKLSTITSTFNLIIILVVLFSSGFAFLDNYLRTMTENPIFLSLLFFGIIYFILDIVNLPFEIYQTFTIEDKFGFNKTTPKTFALDKIKSYVLTIIIGGGILALIVFLFTISGKFFWFYAWIAITVISIFFTLFYTDLIVPIFNKIKPLKRGKLKTEIEKYAKKVNFPLKNIKVIDSSKRTTKANAYFSGLGKKKTIILFDTIIKDMTTSELLSVIAHEIGHYKKKHTLKTTIISIIHTGILLFILGFFVNSPALSLALGSNNPSFHLGLLAFSILYSPISIILSLFTNAYSRKNEYEADNFAKKTNNPKQLSNALKKLSIKQLSNLEPHPLYVKFHYSHPPTLKRIKNLENKNI